MDWITEWISNNVAWTVIILAFIFSAIRRLLPTTGKWPDLITLVEEIFYGCLPNKKKGGGYHK